MNETLRGKARTFPMTLCEELSNLLCIGTKAAESVLKELGMEPGIHFPQGMKKINKERIAKANFRHKEHRNEEKFSVATKRQRMTSWLNISARCLLSLYKLLLI